MFQNKIYQNYLIEILKNFFIILLGLSVIAWTVKAVNFLDLIVENGYPITTYFYYSFLNLFGIITRFFPLAFLVSISIFIVRQIQEKEFIILWTSGVKKIEIVNFFFKISIFVTLLYLIFSVFITPVALNKSRMLLGDDKITSFIPTIRVQQFSDSFNGLTFIVDEKTNNEIQNIFLQDTSNILKNISSNEKSKSNTIIAKSGLIEDKGMILFKGQIISANKDKNDSEIVKFDQLKIDLGNLQSTSIKEPKIQETSTIKLLACVNNNFFNEKNCSEKLIKEIIPTLNRRIILPCFIPVITLITCLMITNLKKKFFFNHITIFLYSFLVLLYSETIIRYTGLNKFISNLFMLTPPLLILLIYTFLKLKLKQD